MIRYALKCNHGHVFDSWFPSGAAFDALRTEGRLECPLCDSVAVDKAPMAPRIGTAQPPCTARSHQGPAQSPNALSAPPDGDLGRAIHALRERIESETENVGLRFAEEARAIHGGDAPERAIRGQANADETRALLRDGIPVLPLPFTDSKKLN